MLLAESASALIVSIVVRLASLRLVSAMEGLGRGPLTAQAIDHP